MEVAQSCPSTGFLFPQEKVVKVARDLRSQLANIVKDKCPVRKVTKRKLLASQFQSGNPKHMDLIKDMGISIVSLPDGRVQLLHNYANVSKI